MKTINYIEGDATRPIGDGNKIIAHICNDIGRWGKGFVVALSKRSPLPKAAFLKWYEERANNDYGLGAVHFVAVEDGVWVANMIGQHKIAVKGDNGVPPVRYEAIDQALQILEEKALDIRASVHMPRIGCGLAGGEWHVIEPMIIKHLSEKNIEVVIYDFVP